jgi:hypothetical protein
MGELKVMALAEDQAVAGATAELYPEDQQHKFHLCLHLFNLLDMEMLEEIEQHRMEQKAEVAEVLVQHPDQTMQMAAQEKILVHLILHHLFQLQEYQEFLLAVAGAIQALAAQAAGAQGAREGQEQQIPAAEAAGGVTHLHLEQEADLVLS